MFFNLICTSMFLPIRETCISLLSFSPNLFVHFVLFVINIRIFYCPTISHYLSINKLWIIKNCKVKSCFTSKQVIKMLFESCLNGKIRPVLFSSSLSAGNFMRRRSPMFQIISLKTQLLPGEFKNRWNRLQEKKGETKTRGENNIE